MQDPCQIPALQTEGIKADDLDRESEGAVLTHAYVKVPDLRKEMPSFVK